ncbi:MAG: UvrD-helicase domain-containing protein [Chthonomonas sp.]|nr:UvrD-helicase domain-containing protein [Chthonomonas sp.]
MVAPFDLDSLNPQQREAVMWPGGPLQIFAGAGSGKTRVITYRIARLIQDGVNPSRILAVTFTNKAAKEMRERLESLLGGKVRSLWLGTFHSLCARMLRIDGEKIGLSPEFVIYDDGEQLAIVKDILKRMAIDEKSLQPRAALNEISRAKEQMLDPTKYEEQASGYLQRMVAGIYPEYQTRLARANALDFDDILYHAVRLLERAPEVLEKYQDRFMHVLIDEYQDVNFTQYRFAQLISAKHRNITIVGDDDQSIYAWRGADVSLMLRFSSDHKDAKVITLGQNYRSTKVILQAAADVIQHNRGRAEKELWTENEAGRPISVTEAGTDEEEAMIVADAVLKAVRSGRRKYGEFGVLYRTNAQSRAVEEAFLTMRIPHILVGGQRFYERREIKDILGYLRVILNPLDEASIKRTINTPTRGLGAGSIGLFDEWSRARGLAWWDAIREQSVQSQLPKRALHGLQQFVGLVEEGRDMMQDNSVTEMLEYVMARSGYLDSLKQDRSEDSISRLENLQELVRVTQQYDETADEPSLFGFLEQIALIADTDQIEETGEAVTLMTLHSSKGLEYPVVFLIGMEEGVFPHSRAIGNEIELEEERRLCYVGMTRAREELHLLHSRRRSMYGSANFNRRSRFLDDVDLSESDSLVPQKQPQAPFRDLRQDRTGGYAVTLVETPKPKGPAWKPPFTVGERVQHAKFGIGVVISCSPVKGNDAEVTVAFPGVTGVKKLIQSFAKLETV